MVASAHGRVLGGSAEPNLVGLDDQCAEVPTPSSRNPTFLAPRLLPHNAHSDWAFQGPQVHRRHVTRKSAEGEKVLTAIEVVPGSLDAIIVFSINISIQEKG